MMHQKKRCVLRGCHKQYWDISFYGKQTHSRRWRKTLTCVHVHVMQHVVTQQLVENPSTNAKDNNNLLFLSGVSYHLLQ